jgi:lipopolysaccharide export system protein LptA
MARISRRASLAALALLAPLALLARPAGAQPIDMSHGGPVTVTALGGIDWDQSNQTVTAHEDARAVRGNVTVTADRLIAHYRKKAGAAATPPSGQPSGAAPAAPVQKVSADAKPAAGAPTPADDTGNNEIYRLNAEGHVHIFTQTDQAWGDHAVYDIDQAVLVLTGSGLRLTTPTDVLTARDAMEYWSVKHMAVARGDAVATSNDGRRITADTLVGYTVDPNAPPPKPGAAPAPPPKPARAAATDPGAPGKLQRVEAYGHVRVQTPTEIVTGDRGVYLPDTGLAHVVGNVHITRGENQLNGASAIVNMKTGLATLTQAPGERVKGLVVPNGSGGGSTPGGPEPPDAARKKPAKKPAQAAERASAVQANSGQDQEAAAR